MHAALPFLNEEHQAVIKAAQEFSQRELLHDVIDRDEAQRFPTEAVAKMGSLGFMGMNVPERWGGANMDSVSYSLAMMEIAKVDASAAVCMAVNNSLVCWGINAHGTDEQKESFLKPLASGKKLGAFCLSEPEAGSDATTQRTTALLQGDHYLLNGTKNWISNGGHAGFYLVIAQSDASKKHKGINAFLVERDREGVVVGKKENKMGIRSSDTHTLMFSDVAVPRANRLGEEGEGFRIAMNSLNGGRISIAAQATGIAWGAYDLSRAYAKERKAFGQAIAFHQGIQFKLARMAMQVEAARLLTLQAAKAKDDGIAHVEIAATAKLYASEIAQEVTAEAVQVHGGYGYVKEYHVERMMRDAKITQIYEGTSEILRLTIARSLLGNLS